jgi:hypothetical protein
MDASELYAYRDAQKILWRADAEATAIHAKAYNRARKQEILPVREALFCLYKHMMDKVE